MELDGGCGARDECLEVGLGQGRDVNEVAGEGHAQELGDGQGEPGPTVREEIGDFFYLQDQDSRFAHFFEGF